VEYRSEGGPVPEGEAALTALVDTSVVVRYLTGDQRELADRAGRIIDSSIELRIPEIVLVEAAHVLERVYRIPRDVVVDHLIGLLQRMNIRPLVLDKPLAIQALLLCRPSNRVSFPDAMIWASVRASGAAAVYSFDERFPADGIVVRRGP
jgi:predicted nucleic acid-binding protein